MHPYFLKIPLPDRLPWVGGGTIPIHAYGVMVALGMLAAIWVTVERAKRSGVDPDVFYDMGLWSMLAGIAGARIAYVVSDWEHFRGNLWQILQIWKGGQVLFGGLLLAVVVNLLLLRARNLPVLRIADIAAPAVPLGIGIGRIGCFLNGCCWGIPAGEGFPLAFRFPERSLAGGGAIHPSQLYATILGITGYVVLSVWFERRRWEGQILSGMLIVVAVARMVEELFRADTDRIPRFWGTLELNPGQYASVYLLAAGVLLHLLWGARANKRGRELESGA